MNNQYSGVRLTTEVRIQPKHDSTFTLKFENPKFVSYNDEDMELTKDWQPEQRHGKVEEIPRSLRTWLESSFTVFHKKGKVEKIQTENGEPEFIVNIKKALVSQAQHDLSKAFESGHLQQSNQVQRGQESPLPTFKVQENSILGTCETIYSISKLPEHLAQEFEEEERQRRSIDHEIRSFEEEEKLCEGKEYYEILKSDNMDNCSERPVYHSTYGMTSKTTGSEASKPTQSSLTRTIVCGSLEDHIIRKSSTENRILINTAGELASEEKINVASTSTMVLLSIESVRSELSGPSSPKGYTSLTFEYPSGSSISSKSLRQQAQEQQQLQGQQQLQNQQQQAQQQGQQQAQQQQRRHAAVQDITSAPNSFYPKTMSERELKEKIVDLFSKIIEESQKMSESSKTEKDVAGMSVEVTMSLGELSFDGLKQVEESLKEQYGEGKWESLIEKTFYDFVSMAGTNPCVKLVVEKINSGEIRNEPIAWSWIISNTLRHTRYPSEEVLSMLVRTLKSQTVEQSRVIRAAYSMGLTELVNKACIDEKSSEREFPYQVYGKICHKHMDVIKSELIPYLKEKLQESSRTDMNSILTWVNALGNLGTEETTEELLKVIQGKYTKNANPRTMAIYLMIRPAQENPAVYRPIFSSIVENTAESPEVRMAAITALTYCKPSSADLQRLALRTWYEPSRQVASYIYSTLKTLKNLPAANSEYETLKQKAEIILSIAKPVKEGIQYSRNIHVANYIESFRSVVGNSLVWQADEDSFLPKSLYFSSQIKGLGSNVDSLEAYFYMQGTQQVVDKLYELYSELKAPKYNPTIEETKEEIRAEMEKLGVQSKQSEKPEAHLTLRMAGLQKLYSMDEEFVQTIVKKISTSMIQSDLEKGLETEFLKVFDIMGEDLALPTESGLPVYITLRYPAVLYGKANLKVDRSSPTEPRVEVEAKGALNYKRQVQVRVVSPITEKFYSSGVETSVHMGYPVKAELSVSNNQVRITLKEPYETNYQRKQTFLEYDVHPYTSTGHISQHVSSKVSDVKTIKSMEQEMEVLFYS